ncbi:DUF1295 domain containing protein [Nitzschia inconspicua]|uniref:DUF1295 domain containing protein n=1 Tax=Nitzschia inconspicua TaxID=303405 RepID=A0A9K3Q0B3_9STRA|nr:DUF1295 domain containing protein [Nitzschia inconspicua]
MGILINAAVVTVALQFSGFVVAAILQTEVFYDILGGINFLSLAYLGYNNNYYYSNDDDDNNNNNNLLLHVTTILFVVSRGWLLVFLAWRAHSRKGDSRFDNVKNNPPMFLIFWMVQACWVFLISMPLLVIQYDNAATTATAAVVAAVASTTAIRSSLTVVELVLLAGFGFAVFMEIISDIQKTLWIQRGRPGGLCTDGFWSVSRHPNYAGEILQWWCAAGLAIVGWSSSSSSSSSSMETSTSPLGMTLPWISLVSPLFTMQILLTMSATGVWNAEGNNLKRYYENDKVRERYIQYRSKTPPLFPIPFYESIPLSVKRLLCFEWERYEYKKQ